MDEPDKEKCCGYVTDPHPKCFCREMDSGKISHAVRYCMGGFGDCPIYRMLTGADPNEQDE